jgi:hypothetical protein
MATLGDDIKKCDRGGGGKDICVSSRSLTTSDESSGWRYTFKLL